MKWNSYYWGIEIITETKEDVILLKTLAVILPEQAENSYLNGHQTLKKSVNEKFFITFER